MGAEFEMMTIGAYGFDERAFFQRLGDEGVELFCDIRQRRGMRGRRYSFANAVALRRGLAAMSIPYVHRRDLAPSQATRQLQHEADRASGITARSREILAPAYVASFSAEVLASLDAPKLLGQLRAVLDRDLRNLVLFCVEENPAACHRALIAAEFSRQLGCSVRHLKPQPSSSLA